MTTLLWAALNGHALAVEALLVEGADIGQVDKVRKRQWAGRWVDWGVKEQLGLRGVFVLGPTTAFPAQHWKFQGMVGMGSEKEF
jgi:hypothetical protein